MHVPFYAKIGSVILAILSLFWLPWICSLLLMFLAGLAFPLAAFSVGLLADLLYYPGSGWLWGATAGLITSVIAAGVRHFVKTRII